MSAKKIQWVGDSSVVSLESSQLPSIDENAEFAKKQALLSKYHLVVLKIEVSCQKIHRIVHQVRMKRLLEGWTVFRRHEKTSQTSKAMISRLFLLRSKLSFKRLETTLTKSRAMKLQIGFFSIQKGNPRLEVKKDRTECSITCLSETPLVSKSQFSVFDTASLIAKRDLLVKKVEATEQAVLKFVEEIQSQIVAAKAKEKGGLRGLGPAAKRRTNNFPLH